MSQKLKEPKIKTPLKTTPILALARQIAERSNTPMSIHEIRAKFNPPFPFHVKKVGDETGGVLPMGSIIRVVSFNFSAEQSYCKKCEISFLISNDFFCEDIPTHIPSSCSCGKAVVCGAAKNWVLV